jgi:ribosomal protein S4
VRPSLGKTGRILEKKRKTKKKYGTQNGPQNISKISEIQIDRQEAKRIKTCDLC